MKAAGDKGLTEEIEEALAELQAFVSTDEFRALLTELWNMPLDDRASFVLRVILDRAELQKRGIRVPEGCKVMRSAFRDNRPTLFCVARYIPDGRQWSKVTVTFDNPSGEPAISYPRVADGFRDEVTTGTHL